MTDRKATTPPIPAILKDLVRNRGVAFSAEERDQLGLTALTQGLSSHTGPAGRAGRVRSRRPGEVAPEDSHRQSD